jgi:hypothetical protein
MPLLELWSSNPATISQFTIEQIVKTSGSGTLQDASDCSSELRTYLLEVSSEKLAEYIDTCLTAHFPNSGRVLQDLINELGRRLDYKVTNGRYQGTVNAIGYDGIWVSPEGQSIVVEVKTTDAYRISLDTIAGYRERLLSANSIAQPASALIVVGREDTGELEAQVRGSRHAWDMRLISTDALIKLVQLKEGAEEPETGRKIRSLLAPMEYTRLDQMVDVMFNTAKDVESAAGVEIGTDETSVEGRTTATDSEAGWEFTDADLLQSKREQIISALSNKEGHALIRRSRALFWSADHATRAAVTISKRYTEKGRPPYWYGYRPQWREFLKEAQHGYVVLGCMDRNDAFAIPSEALHPLLSALDTTETNGSLRHWHLHLQEDPFGALSLSLPKQNSSLQLSPFRIAL